MRRFWDKAWVQQSADGFTIMLDDRPMRVPHGGKLVLSSPALADAIAAEWQAAGGAKGGETSYDDVKLTGLAGTAQDRIAPNPAPVADALARYAESDLLCYRADQPLALVERQNREWQPWLDWAAQEFGAKLTATSGIGHVAQDQAALAAFGRKLTALDPAALAALGVIVPALGSLVLGLALEEGRLSATEAYRLSILDELFQEELWGTDAEAAHRRQRIAEEVEVAERFLRLSRRGAA